jgi:hypothetical protein
MSCYKVATNPLQAYRVEGSFEDLRTKKPRYWTVFLVKEGEQFHANAITCFTTRFRDVVEQFAATGQELKVDKNPFMKLHDAIVRNVAPKVTANLEGEKAPKEPEFSTPETFVPHPFPREVYASLAADSTIHIAAGLPRLVPVCPDANDFPELAYCVRNRDLKRALPLIVEGRILFVARPVKARVRSISNVGIKEFPGVELEILEGSMKGTTLSAPLVGLNEYVSGGQAELARTTLRRRFRDQFNRTRAKALAKANAIDLSSVMAQYARNQAQFFSGIDPFAVVRLNQSLWRIKYK